MGKARLDKASREARESLQANIDATKDTAAEGRARAQGAIKEASERAEDAGREGGEAVGDTLKQGGDRVKDSTQ